MTGRDLVAVAALDTSMILNPGTGEVAPADDPSAVATMLTALRELQTQVTEQRKNAEMALAEHARVMGTKTLHLDGRKVEVKDGDRVTYDPDVLERLLELGLPESRWNELVTLEVKAKVNGNVARQLAGVNEDYKAVIEAARIVTPGNLYVSVS